MLLVWVEENCPDELIADVQEVYGLDARTLDKDYLATLVSQLRAGSRIYGALNGETAYSVIEHLLALIEYDMRGLLWQRTEDGARGINKPKPPITMPDFDAVKDTKADMEKVASLLNIDL